MEEENRVEIMSVELAMRRELAYRHKMAILDLQSANHSALKFMPSQFGPASSSSLDCSLPTNQKDAFFCKLCQVSCSGYICYKQHVKGNKHKANVNLFPFKVNDYAGNTTTNLRKKCGLCDVWCMDESSYMQHLEGQKHKSKLHKSKFGGSGGDRNMVKKQKFC